MSIQQGTGDELVTTYKDAVTRTVSVGGDQIAYRDLGPRTGIPVVFLTHLSANLDNWDPRVVDGIAAQRRVITVDYRGVGGSMGAVRDSVEAMADDAAAFIRALGLDRVDILGLSLGGMVAQSLTLRHQELVRKLILAGTGPAGGEGIQNVTRIANRDLARALLTFQDPKVFLFFTRTLNGKRSAADFLARLKERTVGRDRTITFPGYRTQLKAIHHWGLQDPDDLSVIRQPVLAVNGDNDRMVPTINTKDLAGRIPGSELIIYPDAGHGGIFQHHRSFVTSALDFLDR
ncbi:alpha/beta hydrolase [Arthrobacter sp. 24S4-2]|uniref:alpha/beta fold hydrolase n=1 Tax=Arthrobacter sp. 24S4-2 TaxID=2575374 RepID=UPI0010C774EF|nr:alpha/beta hydrolase [Arthrobacter sp. 24S4-2]QCP00002.1 alpha/beta hydrolase [Arthrobacter sp. 24S4-2]